MDMDDLKARLNKHKNTNRNTNRNKRSNVNVGMKKDVVGSGGGISSGEAGENEEESLDPEVLEILQNVLKFRS